MDLWDKAGEMKHCRRVSSVLIGLEGSAWGKINAFGLKHGNVGKRHPVTALANHKWSWYRQNYMHQIPADLGGMHMTVTRWMFNEIQTTCDKIGVLDPVTHGDGSGRCYDRNSVAERICEKEIFKMMLSSNSKQAKQTVEWMKDYAELHRLPAHASAVLCPRQARRKDIQRAQTVSSVANGRHSAHSLNSGVDGRKSVASIATVTSDDDVSVSSAATASDVGSSQSLSFLGLDVGNTKLCGVKANLNSKTPRAHQELQHQLLPPAHERSATI